MILCCGEALIDMLPGSTLDGKPAFVPHTGGSVFNTSIAIGRLGADVGLLTGLSTDPFGVQLLAELRASNVDTAGIIRSDRPTTLAFVHLADGQARYSFFDENSAGRLLAPCDFAALPDAVTALFFGGISLVGAPAADTYLELAKSAESNRLVMLDPNIRPTFIQHEEVYRERLGQMIRIADILKVSDEDLNWLCRGPSRLDEKVGQLRATDAQVLIVTRGSEGATAYLGSGEVIEVKAPEVAVAETVGAGDTFNAGVLVWLEKSGQLANAKHGSLPEHAWRDALHFASRVAAITVSRSGANPPWLHELD